MNITEMGGVSEKKMCLEVAKVKYSVNIQVLIKRASKRKHIKGGRKDSLFLLHLKAQNPDL